MMHSAESVPLKLERKGQEDDGILSPNLAMTPSIGEDYWAYRVIVGEHQAVVGFPKFFTVGIGFAVEEDWNTNLPYTCSTEEIWEHIRHNKGDENIPDAWCIRAIEMIQEAARIDGPVSPSVKHSDGSRPWLPTETAVGADTFEELLNDAPGGWFHAE